MVDPAIGIGTGRRTLSDLGLTQSVLRHTGRDIAVPHDPRFRFRAWGDGDEARRFRLQAEAWRTLRSLIGPGAESALTWPVDVVWSAGGPVGHICTNPVGRERASEEPDLGDRVYAWQALLNTVHAIHRCGWILGGVQRSLSVDEHGIPMALGGYDGARPRVVFANPVAYRAALAAERIELAGLLLAGLQEQVKYEPLNLGQRWTPASELYQFQTRVLQQLWWRAGADPGRPPTAREWMFALGGERAIQTAREVRRRSGSAGSGRVSLLYVVLGREPIDRRVWANTWQRFTAEVARYAEFRVSVHACDERATVLGPLGPLEVQWPIAHSFPVGTGAPGATADALKQRLLEDAVMLQIDEVEVDSAWILVHHTASAVAPSDQWLSHVSAVLGHRVHLAVYSDTDIRLEARRPDALVVPERKPMPTAPPPETLRPSPTAATAPPQGTRRAPRRSPAPVLSRRPASQPGSPKPRLVQDVVRRYGLQLALVLLVLVILLFLFRVLTT